MKTDDKTIAGDPFLDSLVERCLAPYVHLVSPPVLEIMREMLIEAYTTDEVGNDLLERARPREAPLETHDGPKGAANADARPTSTNGAAAPASAGKLGGGRA